jgi:anaerobic ribonucleoside-triphosphate reductase activating protein
MNYGNIKFIDTADGEGVRVSLFVSGCRNHCPGCFNQDTWDFDFGKEFTEVEENEILEGCNKEYISGLTILGGEPFEEENQKVIVELIKKFKEKFPKKTLWMYTGYILDKDLLSGQRKYVEGVTGLILDSIDVLVDGPFILAERNLSLKFRGSNNQRILDKEKIKELRNA